MRRWSPSSQKSRTSSLATLYENYAGSCSSEYQVAKSAGDSQRDVLCPEWTGPMSVLAEPPKSGVKEKLQKADLPDGSQLHKVRPRLVSCRPPTLPPQSWVLAPAPCPLHPGRAVKTCSDV